MRAVNRRMAVVVAVVWVIAAAHRIAMCRGRCVGAARVASRDEGYEYSSKDFPARPTDREVSCSGN